jgi:hypothetical protein
VWVSKKRPPGFIENSRRKNHEHRRHFMSQSAAAAGTLSLVAGPSPGREDRGASVTGALAFSGQQCRESALMAIADINKRAASSRWVARRSGAAG